MSDYKHLRNELMLGHYITGVLTWGITAAVVLTVGLYARDSVVLVGGLLCLSVMLNELRRAGQYRYSQTRNTVVER